MFTNLKRWETFDEAWSQIELIVFSEYNRVNTNLENMENLENSGNWKIVKISGKF